MDKPSTQLLTETIHRSYLHKRVEQIAMFTQDPSAQEVLKSGTIHPLRAVVLRAVMATPGLPNFLYKQTVAPGYRQVGLDVLGIGYNAVTVSDGPDRVRKFYRHTAGASEAEQVESIKTWTDRQALTLEHLGAYTIAQTFSIEEDPLHRDESIVSATQKRISFKDSVNIFTPDRITDMGHSFLADSKAMYEHTSGVATPDLIGRDNAVIETSTGEIRLVDPIALTESDPDDISSYKKMARFLKEYSERT